MSCCNHCHTDPCCCACGEEAPVMDLATYPPIEEAESSTESTCPVKRFYDVLLYEIVVPDAALGGTVTAHVCDSAEYFAGMYVNIFDGATYVGLFLVTDIVGPTTIRLSNTGVDGNQPAGYTAAAGSYLIVAQPPEVAGVIGPANIPNDSICTQHIGDACITTPKLAPDAVTNSELADDAVRTENILDGTIQEGDLGFLPWTTWLGQNSANKGYAVAITPLDNTAIEATLQVIVSAEVNDVVFLWGCVNMYSPNCYLALSQVGGTGTADAFVDIPHTNDTSVGDYTNIRLFGAFKCTAAGTLNFNIVTVGIGSAGNLGRLWLSACRMRSNPGS